MSSLLLFLLLPVGSSLYHVALEGRESDSESERAGERERERESESESESEAKARATESECESPSARERERGREKKRDRERECVCLKCSRVFKTKTVECVMSLLQIAKGSSKRGVKTLNAKP